MIPPHFLTWLESVLAAAELVSITEPIVACRDPKDDKFLELAVNGGADVIVSGDADLLVLNPFRGIAIISPAVFVQRRKAVMRQGFRRRAPYIGGGTLRSLPPPG